MNELKIDPKDLLPVNLVITHKRGLPAIEIRRTISDINVVKSVIYCALNDIPVTILPSFSNKILALNALQDKGIIYFDKETNEYNFNI
jgi:hypothetical protein